MRAPRGTIILAVVGVVVLGACGSDTMAPSTPFLVTMPSQVVATGHAVLQNGATVYQCDFPITVTASGGSGHRLGWAGGQASFRLTANGQTSALPVTQQDQITWFGSVQLLAGQSVQGTLRYTWSGPYTVALVMNYSVWAPLGQLDDSRATTIALTCQ